MSSDFSKEIFSAGNQQTYFQKVSNKVWPHNARASQDVVQG
jgi:hypothetical protein